MSFILCNFQWSFSLYRCQYSFNTRKWALFFATSCFSFVYEYFFMVSILVNELYSLQLLKMHNGVMIGSKGFNTRKWALFFATIIDHLFYMRYLITRFNTRKWALFFATEIWQLTSRKEEESGFNTRKWALFFATLHLNRQE